MEKKKAGPARQAFFSNPVLLPQHYQSMEDLDTYLFDGASQVLPKSKYFFVYWQKPKPERGIQA